MLVLARLSAVIGALVVWLSPAWLQARSPDDAHQGKLSIITYNVAGLPEGISRSRPIANLPRIGELLNRYDLAVVQEDFAYPTALRQNLRLPFGSAPFVRGERLDFGDGLSQFTRLPLLETERTPWSRCNGITEAYFDCLTPKGFMRARVELLPGTPVDVYDLHMDAGWAAGDREARAAQLEQLARAIQESSAGHAVIVAGDFNLTRSERALLRQFEERTQLRDACFALRCPEPERIDRVLFRGSSKLALKAERWRAERSFVDDKGRPLSDHLPVVVELAWRRAVPNG
jgi:endonuclease/exonuclease/phosphatase family metal-dependent hydrolase